MTVVRTEGIKDMVKYVTYKFQTCVCDHHGTKHNKEYIKVCKINNSKNCFLIIIFLMNHRLLFYSIQQRRREYYLGKEKFLKNTS